MDRLRCKLASSSLLSHGTDIGIGLDERFGQLITESIRLHPVKTMLENSGSTMMATFDGTHGSMQSDTFLWAKVSSTMQDVIVIKDCVTGLQLDLELTRHVVALGIIQSDITLFSGTNTSVRLWYNVKTFILVQGPFSMLALEKRKIEPCDTGLTCSTECHNGEWSAWFLLPRGWLPQE